MWFATDHGVARYNGYRFDNFTTDNGLTDNTVFDLQEDEEGNIWFVTFTGGLCYYDGKTVRPHPMNDSIKSVFARQLPTSIKVLKGKKVWMGVVGKGFYKITPQEFKFFPFDKAQREDTVNVYLLNLAGGQFVYASAPGAVLPQIEDKDVTGISAYKVGIATFKYTGLNFLTVKASNDEILIGVWQYLIRVSKAGVVSRKEWPRDKKILFLKKLDDGSIWVTNSNAPAYKLSIAGNAISFIDSLQAPKGISDMYAMPGNSYWLTTLDKGVFLLPNTGMRIFSIPPSINSNPVSLLAANKKYLYVGLPNNVIMTIDKGMKSSFTEGRKEPIGVSGMVLSDSGRVMTNLEVPFNWTTKGFFITRMITYDSTRLLIGGDGGFAIVKGFEMVVNSHDLGFRERVADLLQINKKQFAVGTAKGLYYINPNTTGTLNVVKEKHLGDVRVTALASQSDNVFAVATRGKGVYLFANGKHYSFNDSSEVLSSQAECLLFENDSTLWVGTYDGLEKIVYRLSNAGLQFEVRSYAKPDGLPGTQVNCIAQFGSYIWIATSEGLCYFKPGSYKFETLKVPVYFSDLYVNGKPRALEKTELAYNEDNIRIDFGALYYNSPGNIRYKVRLNEEDWTYSKSNSAMYYSLPSGKYCLQVQAEDKYGKYISSPESFYFTITPHFTETFLFRSVIALLILLAVVIVVALFFRFQKMKSENLIKLLQYEFKALNYQINPHFVFNVLNSIQYFVIRKDSDKAVFFLNSFSRLIRKIVNNSRQQHISITEEVEFLQEYLDLERLRLDGKFEYTIEIGDGVDTQTKLLLPMVLQPIVENSIWHGIVPADRLGTIDLRFLKQRDCIICEIEDNGVGLKHTEKKSKPAGLSIALGNVKERLKIAAEMYDSEWSLTIQDKTEINGDTGTIVTIKFPHAKE